VCKKVLERRQERKIDQKRERGLEKRVSIFIRRKERASPAE